MGPRWKGKGSEVKALANAMSRLDLPLRPSYRLNTYTYNELKCKHARIFVPQLLERSVYKVVMGPRWKGKGSEVKALANAMSRSILDLQCSLKKSNSEGILSGCSILLACDPEQTYLLNLTCFGQPIITAKDKHDQDKHWFEFTLEEAFLSMLFLKMY
nr:tRNA-splicing endonuclease subunit Sen2-1-like [Tanacetum cinerariifolium]